MDCRKGLMRRNTSAGLVGTARWQGHAEQLEKPSSPRREIGGGGKTYNPQHREDGGRGGGFGWGCCKEGAEERLWGGGARPVVRGFTQKGARAGEKSAHQVAGPEKEHICQGESGTVLAFLGTIRPRL